MLQGVDRGVWGDVIRLCAEGREPILENIAAPEIDDVDHVRPVKLWGRDQLAGDAMVGGVEAGCPDLRLEALAEDGNHRHAQFLFSLDAHALHIVADYTGSAGGENKYGACMGARAYLAYRLCQLLRAAVHRVLLLKVGGEDLPLRRVRHTAVGAVHLVGEGEFMQAGRAANGPVGDHRAVLNQYGHTGGLCDGAAQTLGEAAVSVL